jgi:hypothetical protein
MFKTFKSCWKTIVATAALLAASVVPSLGQASGAHYSASGNYNLVDNRANCATYQCFVPQNYTSTGANASFSSISTGGGYVLGLNQWGGVYTLPTGADSGAQSLWALAPQTTTAGLTGATGPIKQLAVRNSTEIYALVPNATCTSVGGAGVYAIYEWQSSQSSWAVHNGCLSQFSISLDGIMVGTSKGQLFYSKNPATPNATWAHFSSTGWTNSFYYGGLIYAQKGVVMYVVDPSTGTATSMGGGNGTGFTVASDGTALVVGMDGYLYTMDLNVTSPVWARQGGTYLGGTTSLYGTDILGVFALNSAGVPSHYLVIAMTVGGTLSGYYDCTVLGGHCPAGAVHTLHFNLAFPHGIGNGEQQVSGAPGSNLAVQSNDLSLVCDPYFGGWDGPGECWVGTTTSQVQCSVMGFISNPPPSVPKYTIEKEIAFTKYGNVATRATPPCRLVFGFWECTYTVVPICSNTNNPDYKYASGNFGDAWIRDYDFPAWNSVGFCSRVDFPTGHSTWLCVQGTAILTIGTGNLASGVCTYNP